MKRMLSVGVIVIMMLLAACNQSTDKTEANKEERVTPVETVKATKGDLVLEKTVHGRTSPANTTPVMLQNPGEIETLKVENGDKVKKDDTIAIIKTPFGKQTIKASKAGEIMQLKAEEGDLVSDTEPLAMIVNLDTMIINTSVTSEMRAFFEKDMKVKLEVSGKEYEANLSSIGKMPDDTGLYPIEAKVENKEANILPGMIGTMFIPEKRLENVILLPTAAIVEETDGVFIYIIKNEAAVKKEITIKETQSDQTAIEGDVREGDQIVINGQLTLSDGSKVNVVKEG